MRIVIVGAGYGGLRAAVRLGQVFPDSVHLVSASRFHCVTTRLHKVAAGTLPPSAAQAPLADLPGLRNVQLYVQRAVEAHPDRRAVTLEDGSRLEGDVLILALGAELDDFGISGLAEWAATVGSFEAALDARGRLAALFERAERGGAVRCVVGGGGVTGVQVAGEIASAWRRRAALAGEAAGRLELVLLEGADRLLPGLHPSLAERAAGFLRQQGVRVLPGRRLEEVEPGLLRVWERGRRSAVACDLLIWTGGVKGNALIARSLPADSKGRALVSETLEAQGHPGVHVIGDCARAIPKGSAEPAPPTAQAALAQADYLARRLAAARRGRQAALGPYRSRSKGLLFSAGPEAAGELGGVIRGSGRPWRALKGWVDRRYLKGLGAGSIPLHAASEPLDLRVQFR